MFALDPRLESDTFALAESTLSMLRALDDARYAWLVLIPKRADSVEWFDLPAPEQAALFEETMLVARTIRASFQATKVNIGQLGNVVRQLHVHVVARHEGDAAWPAPVWGHSPRMPYAADERLAFRARLESSSLSEMFSFG
jgi:diadenosine tetraphosphate (Ap4A) HIT family hydrolase